MQQGSSANATATLTDEQILGLDDTMETASLRGGSAFPSNNGVILSEAKDLSGLGAQESDSSGLNAGPQNDNTLAASEEDILNRPSAASQSGAQSDHTAAGPGEAEPAWLAALDAQPVAAAEARQWRDAARDISSIDAAYFSAESGARAGLAERLYQSDPAAFRAMLVDSARMMAARDPQGLADLARQLGMPEAAAPLRPRSISHAAQQATEPDLLTAKAPLAGDFRSESSAREQITSSSAQNDSHPNTLTAEASLTGDFGSSNGSIGQRERAANAARNENDRAEGSSRGPQVQPGTASGAQFPAEAYRTFEANTNDDVGRRMHEAIDRTLSSTLPEGITAGARRRIGEDIFREVHASLASDRELSRRVGETLRDWRFDAAARQQVVTLLTGRARAVLPEVARRVVAEWTSSVLASDRARVARIDAAAARRDITGGRLPEPVSSSTLRPREVDYRRVSDEQILEM